MPSRKRSKDRSARRSRSRHVESETNDDQDEASSQSSTGDMEDQSRDSSRVERATSDSSKKKRRKNDDNDNYFSNEQSRQKTKVLGKKDGKSSYEDEEEEEEEDVSVHKYNKKRRKSERGNNSSNGSIDNSSVSTKKKSLKSKRRSKQDKQDELPIAELLKKAQEQQRTKYEDPVPLPKLTADTIYVQGRNGFNPVKIIGNNKSNRQSLNPTRSSTRSRPIKVAVIFQRIWRVVGSVCQGLLGGIALLHLILMKTYFNDSEDFVNNYSIFSEIHTSIFSLLIAVAVIGTFDKFDLGHVGEHHWRDVFTKRFKSILAIPLYITAFVLHQIMTAKVDDKLTLVHYNSSNITYYYAVDSFNETVDFTPGEIKMWHELTLSKDVLAVLGWFFASVDSQQDMFLGRLEEMNNYADKINT